MRVFSVLAAGVVVVAGLAGCGTSTAPGTGATTSASASATANGIESMSVQQILDATRSAAAAQKSVHITAKAVKSGSGSMTLDLSLVKGAGGYGTISMGSTSFQIIDLGSTMYFKADASFWETFGGGKAASTMIGDRWVKMPSNEKGFSDLGALTDFSQSMTEFLKPSGTITKGATKTIAGQPALGLQDTDGSTLWIATTGDPLPLLISSPESASASASQPSGGVVFSDWNAVAPPVAPAAADVLDLSQIPMG